MQRIPERFFQLAVPGGFVGLINANSFMKREFGKKLIEEVLKRLELSHVFDTSGAYIPGHGTPTVLLFGRNRAPLGSTVRAVLGKRGEPETPADAAKGLVWSDIAGQWERPGFESDYVSVVDAQRATFDAHPWSLGGGGAAELKELLEAKAERRLNDLATAIGVMAVTGEDDVYVLESVGEVRRLGVAQADVRPFGIGENLRDWAATYLTAIYPHREDGTYRPVPTAERHLWRYRAHLSSGIFFGKTKTERGMDWRQYAAVQKDKLHTPLSIVFAFVATHNHFVLDRGGKVFNRSAPIIKLPEGATEDDHLALLAYLNSSTACFWMKQVFYPKARSDGDVGEDKGKPEANRYEFTGTGLLPLPLPPGIEALASLGRRLTELGQERAACAPGAVLSGPNTDLDLRARLDSARRAEADLQARMVALQEDLDWAVYALFGLASTNPMSDAAAYRPEDCPYIATTPPELTSADRAIWEQRQALAPGAAFALLENPIQKRRWLPARGFFALKAATYEDRAAEAAGGLVASRFEAALHGDPAIVTASTLRSRLHASHADAVIFEELLDPARAHQVADRLLAADAVPYLAALRHTDAGLEKRAQWEKTWALQRREDAGETLHIPVPPKYDAKDFRDPGYFRLRGKLDVPKERFISYPGAEKDDDRSPLYGWAGWDHLQQATALAALYHERKTEDGWSPDRLVPLLAGLLELVPWLKQWHNAPHDDFGGDGPGDWYERYVEAEARGLGKDTGDLRAWRPEKKGGRR